MVEQLAALKIFAQKVACVAENKVGKRSGDFNTADFKCPRHDPAGAASIAMEQPALPLLDAHALIRQYGVRFERLTFPDGCLQSGPIPIKAASPEASHALAVDTPEFAAVEEAAPGSRSIPAFKLVARRTLNFSHADAERAGSIVPVKQ